MQNSQLSVTEIMRNLNDKADSLRQDIRDLLNLGGKIELAQIEISTTQELTAGEKLSLVNATSEEMDLYQNLTENIAELKSEKKALIAQRKRLSKMEDELREGKKSRSLFSNHDLNISHHINQAQQKLSLNDYGDFLAVLRSLIIDEDAEHRSFVSYFPRKTTQHLIDQLAYYYRLIPEPPQTTAADIETTGLQGAHRWKFINKIILLPLDKRYLHFVLDHKIPRNEMLRNQEKFIKFIVNASSILEFSCLNHETQEQRLETSESIIEDAFEKSPDAVKEKIITALFQKSLYQLTDIIDSQKSIDRLRKNNIPQEVIQQRIALLDKKITDFRRISHNIDVFATQNSLSSEFYSETLLKICAQSLDNISRINHNQTNISAAFIFNILYKIPGIPETTDSYHSLKTIVYHLLMRDTPWTSEDQALLSRIRALQEKTQASIIQNLLYPSIKKTDLTQQNTIKNFCDVLRNAASEGPIQPERAAQLILASSDTAKLKSFDDIISVYRCISQELGQSAFPSSLSDDDGLKASFMLVLYGTLKECPLISARDFQTYYQTLSNMSKSDKSVLLPMLLERTSINNFDDYYDCVSCLSSEERQHFILQSHELGQKYPFIKKSISTQNLADFEASNAHNILNDHFYDYLQAYKRAPLEADAVEVYRANMRSDSYTQDEKKLIQQYAIQKIIQALDMPAQTNFELDEPIYYIIQSLLRHQTLPREIQSYQKLLVEAIEKNYDKQEFIKACRLYSDYLEKFEINYYSYRHLQSIFNPNSHTELSPIILNDSLDSFERLMQYASRSTLTPKLQVFLVAQITDLVLNNNLPIDKERLNIIQKTIQKIITQHPTVETRAELLQELYQLKRQHPDKSEMLNLLLDHVFPEEAAKLTDRFLIGANKRYIANIQPILDKLSEEERDFAKREYIATLIRQNTTVKQLSFDKILERIKILYPDSADIESAQIYRGIFEDNMPIDFESKIKFIEKFLFDENMSVAFREKIFSPESVNSAVLRLLTKNQHSDFDKILELGRVVDFVSKRRNNKFDTVFLQSSLNKLINIYFSKNNSESFESSYALRSKLIDCEAVSPELAKRWEIAILSHGQASLHYFDTDGQVIDRADLAPTLTAAILRYNHFNIEPDMIDSTLSHIPFQDILLLLPESYRSTLGNSAKKTSQEDAATRRQLLVSQIKALFISDETFKTDFSTACINYRNNQLILLSQEIALLHQEGYLSYVEANFLLTTFADNALAASSLERLNQVYNDKTKTLLDLRHSDVIAVINNEMLFLEQRTSYNKSSHHLAVERFIERIDHLKNHNKITLKEAHAILRRIPDNVVLSTNSTKMIHDINHQYHIAYSSSDELFRSLMTDFVLQLSRQDNDKQSVLNDLTPDELYYYLSICCPDSASILNNLNTLTEDEIKQFLISKIMAQPPEILNSFLTDPDQIVIFFKKLCHDGRFSIQQQFEFFNRLPDQYLTEEIEEILRKNYIAHMSSLKTESAAQESIDNDLSYMNKLQEPFYSLAMELLPLKKQALMLIRFNNMRLDFFESPQKHTSLLQNLGEIYQQITSQESSKLFADFLFSTENIKQDTLDKNTLYQIHHAFLSIEQDANLMTSPSGVINLIKEFYAPHDIQEGLLLLHKDIALLEKIYEFDASKKPERMIIMQEHLQRLNQSINHLSELYPYPKPAITPKRQQKTSLLNQAEKIFRRMSSGNTEEDIQTIKKNLSSSQNNTAQLPLVVSFVDAIFASDNSGSQESRDILKASIIIEMLSKLCDLSSEYSRKTYFNSNIENQNWFLHLPISQQNFIKERFISDNDYISDFSDREAFITHTEKNIKARLAAIGMLEEMQQSTYEPHSPDNQRKFMTTSAYFEFEKLNAAALLGWQITTEGREASDAQLIDDLSLKLSMEPDQAYSSPNPNFDINSGRALSIKTLTPLYSLEVYLKSEHKFDNDIDIMTGAHSGLFEIERDYSVPYIALLRYQEQKHYRSFLDAIRQSPEESPLGSLKPIVSLIDAHESALQECRTKKNIEDILKEVDSCLNDAGLDQSEVSNIKKALNNCLEQGFSIKDINQALEEFDFLKGSDNQIRQMIVENVIMTAQRKYNETISKIATQSNNTLLKEICDSYARQPQFISILSLAGVYARQNPDSPFYQAWEKDFQRLMIEHAPSKELSALSMQLAAKAIQRCCVLWPSSYASFNRLVGWLPRINPPRWAVDIFSVLMSCYKRVFTSAFKTVSDDINLIADANNLKEKEPAELERLISRIYNQLELIGKNLDITTKTLEDLAAYATPESAEFLAQQKETFLSLHYEMARLLSVVENTSNFPEAKARDIIANVSNYLSNSDHINAMLEHAPPKIIERQTADGVITETFMNCDVLQGLYASLDQVARQHQSVDSFENVSGTLAAILRGVSHYCTEHPDLKIDTSFFCEALLEQFDNIRQYTPGTYPNLEKEFYAFIPPHLPSSDNVLYLIEAYSHLSSIAGSQEMHHKETLQQINFYYNDFIMKICQEFDNIMTKIPERRRGGHAPTETKDSIVTIFVELQLHGAHAPQLSPQTINALTKIYHSGELSRPHDKYDIALIIARTQPDTPLLKQCYNEMIEFCRDNPASLNTIVVDLLFKTSRYFEKIENNSALLNEFTQSYQEIIGRYILDIERHMPEEHEQRLEAINTIIVMIYKCEQGGALQIPATMMPRIATILQTLDGNIDPEYKQKIAKAQKFLEQSSRVESLIEPSPTSVDKIDAFDVRGYKRRV